MKPEQLLAHFDRFADSPDAISRLRRFVLDFAVRGKLVEQDLKDEPASELLKRIQTEKARLMKQGKIGRQRQLPEIREEELPFEPPPGWSWARLATISRRIHYGFTASANKFLTDVRLLRITDIQNNSVDWSSVPGCEISEREVEQYKLEQGDILIARTGGTIGKSFLVKHIPVVAVFASYLIRVQGSTELNDQYLKLFLESTVYWAQLQEGARGGGQPNVNGQTLGRMIVTIPPFDEQHRIVAKVDELMALCDQLQAAQAERKVRLDQLMAASLHRLRNDADGLDFRESGRFYLDHFAQLTTYPEQIIALRQTIVNLAVRGKLLPQDSADQPEPKVPNHQAGKAGERPFHIPISWTWVSVAEIGESRLGKMLDKAKNKGSLHRYLRNVNVRWFDFDLSDVLEMRFEDSELDEFALRRGDVLICEGGEPGRAAVWDERESNIYFQKALHRVRFPDGVSPHYFVLVLRESADSKRLASYFTGVGIKHLTGKALSSFLFPLPPFAEQVLIVSKVESLLTLCDELEAQLNTAQTESRNFLEAVLNQVLGTASHQADKQKPGETTGGLTQQEYLKDVPSLKQALSKEELQFMNTNPVKTVAQIVECLTALGGTATPERLLNITGLAEDVDEFFALLREARDSGLLVVPTGHDRAIALLSVSTRSN